MTSAAITLANTQASIPKEKGVFLLGCLPEFTKSPINFLSRLMNKHKDKDIVEFHLPFLDMSLVIDGHLTHQILVKHAKQFRKADHDLKVMGTVLGNGLVTNNDTAHHKIQRKLVQPGFHFRKIQSYSETMSDYTSLLIKDWQTGERNISDDMFKLTMYIVCKTLFDTDMQTMEKEADSIGHIMARVQEGTNARFTSAFLLPDWVPTPNNRKLVNARISLDETIERIIDSRRLPNGEFKSGNDMLSMLLSAKYEDGHTMDARLVRDELITLFAAGHETTSNALTWTFYLLAQNPEIQQKLQEELDQVLGQNDANFSHLENLTYTEMVIKESMRLLPPVWTLSARQANEDIQIDDYFIPKDTLLFISPYANHRNPKFFPDPERFDPERFTTENEKKIPKHVYIPFGAGPRICIGMSFAMMEAKLILASIVHKFNISEIAGQKFEPLPQITLSNQDGMKVHLEKRL